MSDIQPPAVLTDKAKYLNDKFYLILNEIVKTYPSVKLDPNKNNQMAYDANMEKMKRLQNEYFLFKNDVTRASENILKKLAEIDAQINGLENQNKVLRFQLDNLQSSTYSAEGLFDDAQITRNELLVSNFIFFGVMCGGGYMYYQSITSP
jgi:hypothetical protein